MKQDSRGTTVKSCGCWGMCSATTSEGMCQVGSGQQGSQASRLVSTRWLLPIRVQGWSHRLSCRGPAAAEGSKHEGHGSWKKYVVWGAGWTTCYMLQVAAPVNGGQSASVAPGCTTHKQPCHMLPPSLCCILYRSATLLLRSVACRSGSSTLPPHPSSAGSGERTWCRPRSCATGRPAGSPPATRWAGRRDRQLGQSEASKST